VRELIRFRGLAPPEPAPAAEDGWAWPVTVHALGGFRVAVDGAPVGLSRKTQKRPLALLAALVAAGPEGAAEHRVADALWPEAGGDAAQNALGTTVHRLRQLLGREGAVRRAAGRIALDGAVCWVDAWAFETLLAQGEDGGGSERTDRALRLYRSPALPEADLPDAVPFRERLREKFVGHSLARGAALEAAGASGPACARYLKSIEAEPAAEPLYLALMRCRAATGRTAEAAAAYQRLRETLGSTLGEPPSAEARALYERLRDRTAPGPAPRPPGPESPNP